MTLNRAQRRQATKEFQAQLASGKLDLSQGVDLAERAAAPKTITLGYPVRGDVRAGFLKSLLTVGATGQEYNYRVRLVDCEHDGNTARAKNLILERFLGTGDEYLLLTDPSIAFAPQDVAMLIAADSPIAGALYFTAATGAAEPWPVAWVEEDSTDPESEDPVQYGAMPLPTPPDDFDENDENQVAEWLTKLSVPIPVAGVGSGLCLIRRSAAEQVAGDFKWPFEVVQNRDEDLTFCLRAASLGLQTVVMPAARVGNLRVAML